MVSVSRAKKVLQHTHTHLHIQDEVTRNEKNLEWTNNGFLLFQLNKPRKLIVTYGDYSQRCKPMVVVVVRHTVTVFCCFVCVSTSVELFNVQYCRSAEIIFAPLCSPKQSFVRCLLNCVFCVHFPFAKVSKQRVHKSIELAAMPNLYFRFNVSAGCA